MFDSFSSNDVITLKMMGTEHLLEKFLRIDLVAAGKIEEKTLGQSTHDSWFIERKKRLAVSNFASVINLR